LVILCQGGQPGLSSTPRNLQFASPLHFPPPEATEQERKSGTHHGRNLVSGISSSSGKDVIAGKVLLADNRSHHHQHHPKASKRPEAAGFPHRVLKFRDLPPWRSQKTFHHKGVEGVGPALSRDPITLDLRQYNPLTAHLLTQSYVYPKSNGLTQTDRDYFAMIQSETGMSDVHFEKGGQEKKIKGDEASSKSRQLADCGRTKMGSSSCISDKGRNRDKTTSTTATITTAATADTTHFTMKPVPRFAFHRVPGSFAAFRVIRPLPDFTLKPPTTTPSYDSYHDDEPPIAAVHQRAQRDVAAVHLVQ